MRSSAPNPPRFCWLKRGAVLFVVVFAGLGVLRYAWGSHTRAKLDALVADAHAHNQPILFEDFVVASVPNDENMAIPVRDALALLPAVNAQGQTIGDTDWYMEGGADYADMHGLPDPVTDNAAYLERFQPVLDALREAAAMDRADWGLQPSRTAPGLNVVFLGELRRLARQLEDAAWRAHSLGDHALALELIGHGLTIARSKLMVPCSLIDGLVAISVRALTVNAIERMLPDIPADPAWRDALTTLRDELLDESEFRNGMTYALYLGRWETYVVYTEYLSGRTTLPSGYYWNKPIGLIPLEYSASRWALNPLYQADLADALEQDGRNADAFAQSDSLGEAYTLLGTTRQQPRRGTSEALQPISRQSINNTVVARTYYSQLAQSRLCATAIAIKLYEVDHGRRPDALSELVPAYLADIPRDPTADGQALIQYRPQGARLTDDLNLGSQPDDILPFEGPAILYGVGRDGDDDGGLIEIGSYDGMIDWHSRFMDEDGDTWFLLDPEPEPYTLPGSASGSLGPGGHP